MIVVVGSPVAVRDAPGGPTIVGGLAGRIALAAAEDNRTVQVVGKVGDDDIGDAVLIALAMGGVGHAAVLRDAAHATPFDATVDEAPDDDPFAAEDVDPAPPTGLPLDPADVQLALRYLTDFRVLVLVPGLEQATVATALDGAGFADAHVIRLVTDVASTESSADGDPVTMLVAPEGDEPAFGRMVGRYAAGLDAGRDPADAFREATTGTNWERAQG